MNKLLNLYRLNAKRGSFRAEKNTIYLYDVIVPSEAEAEFFGGVSAEKFAETLDGMKGDVALRINSPGGDVFAAQAMLARIRDYNGIITSYVDGVAASAASLIAVSSDKTVMAEGAMLMIHKAWTITVGNTDDHLQQASLLEKVDGIIADTYARRSNGDSASFLAAMAAETWYTGKEAVAANLADEISGEQDAEDLAAAWDLTVFDRAPKFERKPAPALEPAPTQNQFERRRRITAVRSLLTAA
jgi:ATP-dependent protease ClpP protease subunit